MLALSKLMAIDAAYCQANTALVFTMLGSRYVLCVLRDLFGLWHGTHTNRGECCSAVLKVRPAYAVVLPLGVQYAWECMFECSARQTGSINVMLC